jgi:hypothetical protein
MRTRCPRWIGGWRGRPKGSRKALLWPGLAYLVAPALVVLLLGLALGWLMPWWLAGVLALAGGAGGAGAACQLPSLWLLRFIIFNDALARRCADSRLADRLDHFADRIDRRWARGGMRFADNPFQRLHSFRSAHRPPA